jgi:hypothetical protein
MTGLKEGRLQLHQHYDKKETNDETGLQLYRIIWPMPVVEPPGAH